VVRIKRPSLFNRNVFLPIMPAAELATVRVRIAAGSKRFLSPMQEPVVRRVFTHHEIRRAIIRPDAVHMMHLHATLQPMPNRALGNVDVLKRPA
jgi:hypothetical protein